MCEIDIIRRNFWEELKSIPVENKFKEGDRIFNEVNKKSGIVKEVKGNSVYAILDGNKHGSYYHIKNLRHD